MKLTGILTAALLVTGVTGISMTSYAAESTEEQTDLASVDLAGAAEAQPMKVDMSDGTYKIDVVLGGGSGRATITSPATLVVKEGCAYAQIEWSSSHYDYMKVGETTYDPINTDGNSVFELPVTVMDKPMDVIADTTAMSVPHEIEYTLTFASDSITSGKQAAPGQQIIYLAVIVAAGVVVVILTECPNGSFPDSLWKRIRCRKRERYQYQFGADLRSQYGINICRRVFCGLL